MEELKEEEEYRWREVKLPSLIPIVPEPELERETGERRRGRDIVIAVDHGPNSKHAFHWALAHLCRLADTLHLIHAVSKLPRDTRLHLYEKGRTTLLDECKRKQERELISVQGFSNNIVYEATENLMENLAVEALEIAMVKTVARIAEGDAGKVICKEAERLKPAAVVMGTRGRSLIQSVLQGSVSEYCFHNCKAAPIIIVPGKEAGEESVL